MAHTLTSSSSSQSSSQKVFCIGMIMPLTKENNADFFLRSIEALTSLGFQVFALAEGDETSQKASFDLLQKNKGFTLLESTALNRKKILQNADVFVFPAQPSRSDLEYVIKNKMVTVLPEGAGLENFDAQNETGEAFTFSSNSFWHFLSAVIRASENYKFPYDWKTIQTHLSETKLALS